MRININLASNPYEAAREYLRRMGLLVGALAVAALALLGYIFYQRSQTRDVDAQIATVNQEIAALDNEKAQALSVLNQPQNRVVADQSQFLNNLFARKALSWTKVFAEMEKLMPPNILWRRCCHSEPWPVNTVFSSTKEIGLPNGSLP